MTNLNAEDLAEEGRVGIGFCSGVSRMKGNAGGGEGDERWR